MNNILKKIIDNKKKKIKKYKKKFKKKKMKKKKKKLTNIKKNIQTHKFLKILKIIIIFRILEQN